MSTSTRADLAWFAAWSAIGALFALSIAGALTIGVFILIVPLIATACLLRLPRASVGRPGLVTGAALPLFYIAFLNRHGPGNICNATHLRCHDEWSPWPWLLAGICLTVFGGLIFARPARSPRGKRDGAD